MLSDEFLYELAQTSKRLGVKPMDLLSVMERESGINPAAYNENGGATGLIQFMPSTAKGLGTTTEALRNMSAVEQLPFVEKFYKQAGFKGGNAGDLYATTFLPARVGRDVLTTEGESFYDANKVLDTNNDGRITTAELAQRAESGYRNVRGLLSNREMSPGGAALPFDINERGVPTEFIPPTPMNLPSSPAPQVAPQGVPQDMPQVAPQAAPQAQPKERSFLDRAIDFASNVGSPLQQLGQGVALIEGDLQSAQALGQMVEGNRKREQMKAKERAAVKMLTDMGYSQDQAAGIVASGNVDTLLNAAVKQKFGGADAPAKAREIEYLMKRGMTYEQAYRLVYGVSGSGASGYRTMTGKEAKAQGLLPAGMNIKDDAVIQVGKSGKVDVLSPGSTAPSLNEAQSGSLIFGRRMLQSGSILDKVDEQGTSAKGFILDNVFGGNYAQSPAYQIYDQAKRDFINATLRKESGAAIADSEFANADIQYFPQPGDSPEVIANKRQLRKLATENMFAPLPEYYREKFYDNFKPLPFNTGLEGSPQQPAQESPQPPASYFGAFNKELTAEERQEAIQMWNEMSDEQRSQYQ